MNQGRFEARRSWLEGLRRRKPTPPSEPVDLLAQDAASEGRRVDWLLLALPILVLAALAVMSFVGVERRAKERALEPSGLTREEVMEEFRELAGRLEYDNMILTLTPDNPDSEDEPIVLTIPPVRSRIRVDLGGLEADLDDGIGKVSRRRFQADPRDYISLDRGFLRELAEQTEAEYGQEFLESSIRLTSRVEEEREVDELVVNTGRRECAISADTIYNTLLEAYYTGNLSPSLTYSARIPQPLDAEAIWEQYTTLPVDASLDMKTFEIYPESPGYGFELQEMETLLAEAEDGVGYILPLRILPPAVTAADVAATLYNDVLGEAHTPHTYVNDRTNNLKLACKAINGTIVMPGQVFSFNGTVGERTEAKGYRKAIAYVGGNSVPEIGGGVCQVASSIYYAVLQADLRTVERYCHSYLVTYVPKGMDAAIYWGSLDYKFENTSPYPIKIEASVSDGQVHIILWGTEWKDYTVELSSEVLEEYPWETVERYVTPGSYQNGETIVTPYTGYRIATYRTIRDKDGTVIETTKIATDTYRKRDKVIAVVVYTPPATDPSDPYGGG